MCTVISLRARRVTGMNRERKLTRLTGLKPENKAVNGWTVLCPSEPGGGTWIALNESGMLLLDQLVFHGQRVDRNAIKPGKVSIQ